jgi:uncharacterized membrane protein HdeD (DUF308 family)
MRELLKKFTIGTVLSAVIAIAFAIILIIYPQETLLTIMKTAGVIAIIGGAILIINYFRTPMEMKMFSLDLFSGMIIVIMGIIILSMPTQIVNIIYIIAGCWMIFENMLKIQLALNIRNKLENSNGLIIAAVLGIILGVLIITHPGLTSELTIRVSGVVLLLFEIANIVETIYINKSLHPIVKKEKEAQKEAERIDSSIDDKVQDVVEEQKKEDED